MLQKIEPGSGHSPAGRIAANRTIILLNSPENDQSDHAVKPSEIGLEKLVLIVVAAFRCHPHISNVVTHISGGNWKRVEQALSTILDPLSERHDLSPLALNLVDLMCAERGVTGRILRPYFQDLIAVVLRPSVAARLVAHVTSLFLDVEFARWRSEQARGMR